MRRRWIGSFLVLSLAFPVLASAAEDPKAVFEANCVKCHGADGLAQTPAGKANKTASLADPKYAGDPDLDKKFRENKKHAPVMKKLNEEQIAAALAHSRTFAPK